MAAFSFQCSPCLGEHPGHVPRLMTSWAILENSVPHPRHRTPAGTSPPSHERASNRSGHLLLRRSWNSCRVRRGRPIRGYLYHASRVLYRLNIGPQSLVIFATEFLDPYGLDFSVRKSTPACRPGAPLDNIHAQPENRCPGRAVPPLPPVLPALVPACPVSPSVSSVVSAASTALHLSLFITL